MFCDLNIIIFKKCKNRKLKEKKNIQKTSFGNFKTNCEIPNDAIC
jgi:hypothetical protein